MSSMSRPEYKKARRLYRDNGCAALNWLPHEQAIVMDQLLTAANETDWLEERANIYRSLRKVGIAVDARNTQPLKH